MGAGLLAAALALPAGGAAAQAMFEMGGETASVRVTSLRDMPFRTVVRQQYDYSCGSAALATLLRHHYGRAVDEAAIFRAMYAAGDQAKIRKVGFSLLDMKRYLAASQALPADGYRWTLSDLERARAPAIALIKVGAYRHFVVVKGVRHGKVLVGDPAQGLKLYALKEFQAVWDGVVFVARPSAAAATYDQTSEWGHFTLAPMRPLSETALGSFTRELPPVFQVVAFSTGGGAIR
jgi:predicted double-glycine peptidase